jgi:hypothetical protein
MLHGFGTTEVVGGNVTYRDQMSTQIGFKTSNAV